jgi:hypothetical protein
LFIFNTENYKEGKILRVVFQYVHPKKVIPLKIEIDEALNYTKITLKSKNRISGYYTFSQDHYGNLIQSKSTSNTTFKNLK